MRVKLNINNREVFTEVKADDYLLDTLRENHFTSVRRGCDSSSCGVCTVLVDNEPIASCTMLTMKAINKEITTVEGIQKEAEKLAEHMGYEGADQCGFCNPSLALTVYALKQVNKKANNEEIKEYLIGNLCRCTGYQSQHIAIKKYLEE